MSAETKAEKCFTAEVYSVSHAIANAMLGTVLRQSFVSQSL